MPTSTTESSARIALVVLFLLIIAVALGGYGNTRSDAFRAHNEHRTAVTLCDRSNRQTIAIEQLLISLRPLAAHDSVTTHALDRATDKLEASVINCAELP